MQIAVIGRGDCSVEEYEAAETIGRLIAGNRETVCCGGLGGVMGLSLLHLSQPTGPD